MSVGYRSKEKAYDSLGYRTQKRKKEKEHKKRRVRVFLLTCIAILLLTPIVWTGGYRLLPWINKHFFSGRVTPRAAFETKQALLFVGARKVGTHETAQAITLAVYDPKKQTLAGFSIPEDLFVEVPGQNFEKVSESLLTGVTTTKATVRNLLGMPIDHYIVVPFYKFQTLVKESDYGGAVEAAEDTDLIDSERTALAKALSALSADGVNVMALPAKQLTAGAQSYSEPDKAEIDRLMGVLWGKGKVTARKRTKVIVLNGCGVPGIAGRVAEKLIENGYQVIETKSAIKFDYGKSHIIVYNNETADAMRIQKLLGVGILVSRKMEQDVADIGVIVGADYARLEQKLLKEQQELQGKSGSGKSGSGSSGAGSSGGLSGPKEFEGN